MPLKYDPKKIEAKWQKYWETHGTYRQYKRIQKQYVLDMFPYPSGAGLHVGHPKGYIASDVYARFKQLQGYGVIHPMGWDAFGLPAEQYAIKNKVHPSVAVKKNIATFKKQLQKIGFTYDWEREINTTDPEYYKWTQWIFLQLWKKGLAYESHDPINWCPSCQTGLSNEDVEQGRCERCDSLVEKRPMRQWVLRITAYADKMLRDLDKLDWPEGVKEAQRNWIGRSEGAEVVFYVADTEDEIRVFTTRLDTIYGCTYVVIAPEHPLIKALTAQSLNAPQVKKYLTAVKKKTDLERTDLNKEKSGVCLEGIEVAHPFTGKRLPLYVADYVLGSYGTGAVMGVPAHDERDMAFAKKYDLAIVTAIEPVTGEPRKGEEYRKSIVALVEHPKNGKILSINWGENLGGNLFIGGGLKEEEDAVATALREIREETGYQNVELIAQSETIHHHYFAASKNVYRNIDAIGLHFKLVDEKQEEQKLEADEQGKFKVEWLTKPEAEKRVADPLHKYLFQKFIQEKIYTDDGVLADSKEFTGLSSSEAREKMAVWLKKEGLGKKVVNYKMREWVFSRQRYWGEPIPLIHCDQCGIVPVPEKDLPVKLPNVKSYEPTGTGESPLAGITKWVNVKCPTCSGPAKRETNTMPQWAGSCWYYLRFIDPENKKSLVDKKKEKEWMPVDVYVGGDHATRHLIYARFWHKFLYDQGVVSTPEPFTRLEFLGLILAADGRKMSKRWGNVVNPDDVIAEFGADAFRVYEMFMGPFEQSIAWNTNGVVGTKRFLEKVWKLSSRVQAGKIPNQRVLTSDLHKAIKKVSEDIEEFKFNTAISSLMIFVNALEKETSLSRETLKTLLLLLAPFAPHITEELWQKLGEKESIFLAPWPKYDAKKIVDEMRTIAVQVNGKVRDTVELAPDASEAEAREKALASAKVSAFVEGKVVKKFIYVPGRILNFVVG